VDLAPCARIRRERLEILQRAVVTAVEREEPVRKRALSAETSDRSVDVNVGQAHVAERSAEAHAAGPQRVALDPQIATADRSADAERRRRAARGEIAVDDAGDRRQGGNLHAGSDAALRTSANR